MITAVGEKMAFATDFRPIDPFTPSPGGCYTDDAVTVVRRGSASALDGEQWTAKTEHFQVGRLDGRLAVRHALPAAMIDDDLTVLIRRELIEPGWVYGADSFERIFTGIVLSSRPDPAEAWELFYRNTLAKIEAIGVGGGDRGTGSLGQFAGIYGHAEQLLAASGSRSLLDLGSCFGFFPLRVRAGVLGRRMQVRAADVRPGTRQLLGRLSVRLGLALPVLCCDAAAVPLPDDSVDTVTLLHLLEHVDEAHGRRMLREAVRLARRQVVVAVPMESEADTCYDHVRTLALPDLVSAGKELCSESSWNYEVHEHEGGWLTLTHGDV